MAKKTKSILSLIIIVLLYLGNEYLDLSPSSIDHSSKNNIEYLIQHQQSNSQVQVTAKIFKLLPDDLHGSRHQRFLIKLPQGQTVLIAHNIDLAPKVNKLKKGTNISIYGEYEWNQKGGVIHWTHKDPSRRHIDGWIDYRGGVYQ